jgi:hypothetical protein
MATKTTAKKQAPKEPKERKPRGQFGGKKIRKNVKEWPGKPGTLIANSFELIRNGMTYEQYIEAGGRYIDLVDAIKQGHVTVE